MDKKEYDEWSEEDWAKYEWKDDFVTAAAKIVWLGRVGTIDFSGRIASKQSF